MATTWLALSIEVLPLFFSSVLVLELSFFSSPSLPPEEVEDEEEEEEDLEGTVGICDG
jgi:hypothetical protein